MDFIKSLKLNKIVENKNSKVIAALLIGLYAAAVAPALPNNIILFFDTIVGKLLFIFMIAYMASKDIQVALMLAIAFVTTLSIINYRKIERFQLEGFEDNQSCADYCKVRRQTFETDFNNTYNNEDADFQTKYDELDAKKTEYTNNIKDLMEVDMASRDYAEIAFNKTKVVNKNYAINLLKKYAAAHGKTINTTSEDIFTDYEGDDNESGDNMEGGDVEDDDDADVDEVEDNDDADVEEGFVSSSSTPPPQEPVPANDEDEYSRFASIFE